MGLILKHTLKSMWAHKGRTLILLLSITLCSFAAMMAFGISGTIETALRSAMNTAFGKTDIIVSAFYPLGDDVTDGIPDCIAARPLQSSTTFTEHIPGSYNIIRSTNYTIIGIDYDIKRLDLIPDGIELGEAEAAISSSTAAKLRVNEGDDLTLYNKMGEPFDFTVKNVVSEQKGIFLFSDRIVVSSADVWKMNGDSASGAYMIYIDILDNSRINEAKEILEQNNPAADIDVLIGDESSQQLISYMTDLFTAMFAVLLLLVLFVTISSSQRIITEKMPVIGTFRSLGIPAGMTYTVLLAENALYGLIGSVAGILLDSVVRPSMVSFIASPGTADGGVIPVDTGSTSPALMIAVMVGAMLVECLCPIKEILLAMKTPIRDIIFSNKDTQYRHSRASTILGIVLAVLAVILVFVPDSFPALLVCFFFTAIAAALLFPYLLTFIAGLLAKLASRADMPTEQLAAIEVRQRKSTVGSAVLCFSASSVAIVLYIFASAFGETYSHSIGDADLYVWVQSDTKRETVSYVDDIDGVTETEYIYGCNDTVMINGEPADMQTVVEGAPEGGYRIYTGSAGVPDDLGHDEVVMTKILADKYGLKVGDTVEIKFKSEMFMPITKTLTVRAAGLASCTDSSSRLLVISERLYKEIYKDHPSLILARCSHPASAAETLRNNSAGYIISVETRAEYDGEREQDTAQLMTIINLLIFFAAGMTFIGVVGNQLIGFEGRRRECAVMISTSMTRGKLAKMFLIESFTAAGISLISAVPCALVLSALFGRILSSLMLTLPPIDSTTSVITLGLILWAVFTAVAIFPIRKMYSMKLSEQLKYE